MDPRLLLGLQLTRFAPSNDAADALSSSLTALESGGYALSPYQGPALQPLVGLSVGRVDLALAPAVATRREQATNAEGRSETVRVTQLRIAAMGQYRFGPGRAGLELGWSDGTATLDGDQLASNVSALEVIPTIGVAAPLAERLELSLYARWPVHVEGPELSQSLAGALSLTWRGAGG